MVCYTLNSNLLENVLELILALGSEYNITVWEDQDGFHEGSIGSAPMSESDSEDGMFALPTSTDLRFY